MLSRLLKSLVLGVFVSSALVAVAPIAAAGSTYTVHLDGLPPAGEPWSFLRMFPSSLKVHKGDVVNFAWNGTDTPHTATVVPSADAEAWRAANQGPGGPYEFVILDTAAGGDDGDVILNPAAVNPGDPTCGSPGTPCSFNGSGVTNSGFQFSDPNAEPSFSVKMNAPVGTYSFLCLVHEGMEIPVKVVGASIHIPSPANVDGRAANELAASIATDGPVADAQAQNVGRVPRPDGSTRWVLSAGGFANQLTANEYPDGTTKVHVGDHVRFNGNLEIHTATFPAGAFETVPFVQPVCEVAGADTPAGSPADCADPSEFQLNLNPKVLAPTVKHDLSSNTAFRSSGLLVPGGSRTFTAKVPGLYTFICLVHGPEMESTIRVRA